MDLIIYKVIFRAHERLENENLTLSFKNLDAEKPISVPTNFISELKNLSEQNQHIINFQNIEEVLIIGTPLVDYSYNYYLVVLLTAKSNREKIGYLIGNVKKLGDIIIGIWPFNTPIKDITGEKILKTYHEIIENPNNYSSICLISQ
jgi:hypothetical protein